VMFRANGCTGHYRFQVGAVKGGDFRITHEECLVRATAGSTVHSYTVRDGSLVESSEQIMPPVASDRLYLVAAAGIDPFRPVFDGLAGINVYNLNPDAMRNLQKPEAGELLKRDGSNVASVIERLRRDQPKTKQRIEDYLSRVVEGVAGVDRRGLGAWETVEFRQRVAGDESPWTFQASSMSDGTLRALGVLVSLLAGNPALASPVGVEEPEMALHPAAAGLLLDALRDAAASRQVLVTTHSPDLLDSPGIAPSELLAVRSDGGISLINEVDAGGQRALRESLYTPGELLRVDQLIPATDAGHPLDLFT
jgi:AAA domain, putative AbiEii toxin, Type IV TA system